MYRNTPRTEGQTGKAGRPRDEQTELAILEATVTLFGSGGLAATTFEGVAKLAGASRSSIYRRWNTREDLIVAALQWVRANGESGHEDWGQLQLAEVLKIFRDLTVDALSDSRSMNLLRHVIALPDDSVVRESYWSTIVAPRRKAFAALLAQAQADGELPKNFDAEMIQDQLAGALAYRALVNPKALSRRAAGRYVDQLLESLGLS